MKSKIEYYSHTTSANYYLFVVRGEMEIIDAQVNWMENVENNPVLQVLVDEKPDREELCYEKHGSLYIAKEDGYVRFFAWSGDGNDGGYSGRCYDITLDTGEEITLKGPWSSRAGIINKRGLGPVISVSMTTDEEVMEKGYTFTTASLTLKKAREAATFVEGDVTIKKQNQLGDETYYIPVKQDKKIPTA